MSEPTAESIAQSSAASTGALPDTTATPLTEIDIPDTLRENLALFLRLERRVLTEYDPSICELFDKLLSYVIAANEGDPGRAAADEPVDGEGIPLSTSNSGRAFRAAVELLDSLPVERSQVVVRAFTAFFHLANLSEETIASKRCMSANRA